jgi:PST family polysaccharide transporter
MNKIEISYKTVGRALAWSFAAEIAAKLIVPITNMILARILAPESFGIIATINMIVSFADMFTTTGISKYIVQHEFADDNEMKKNADVAFWTNMFISFTMWFVILIFRDGLSTAVGSDGYGIPLAIAALSLPLNAFSSIQEAVFQRSLDYKSLFYRRIVVSIVPFFVTIPLALLGMGYWGLIIGTLVGNIVKVVLLLLMSQWRPSLYFSFNKLKQMYSFCAWMMLGAVTSWMITYIDVFLVGNVLGEYYTGLYKNSQMTVVAIISIITSATSSVLFASLSREQNENERFNQLLFDFQQKVGMFVIPVGIGIFCFSEFVTKVLLGEQWLEASPFIGAWGLSTALACAFADFCKEVCKAKGAPKLSFVAQILHLLFLVPVCYYTIDYGFMAFGYIRSLANLEMILVYFIIVWIWFKISPFRMVFNLKMPIISAVFMGVIAKVLLYIKSDGFILQIIYIIICVLIYFGFLCVSKQYRQELSQIILVLRNKILQNKRK